MKKFTKISLIIAAVAGGIGLICIIASLALGLNWNTFKNMVREDQFNISGRGISRLARVTHLDRFFVFDDSEEHEDEAYTSAEYEDCENLDIEIGAGSLAVFYGDVDTIQVECENGIGFESRMDGNTLKIDAPFGINSGNGDIQIILPEDIVLDEVDLEIGAGNVEFDILNLRSLDAEIGTGILTMDLQGREKDYNYKVDCAIGKVQIGDREYNGIGREQKVVNPGAIKKIDIECGAGSVYIGFEE